MKETKIKKEKLKKTKKIAKKVSVKEKIVKKPTPKKEVKKEIAEVLPIEKYYEANGKRKTAVARVRLWTKGEKIFLVNQKPLEKYFPISELQKIATDSLETMKCRDKFRILTIVKGGGFHAQAEALRHGIARALILFNPNFRKRLKKAGYLTRDSRMKERKKFGLKRARRAPQWAKR